MKQCDAYPIQQALNKISSSLSLKLFDQTKTFRAFAITIKIGSEQQILS